MYGGSSLPVHTYLPTLTVSPPQHCTSIVVILRLTVLLVPEALRSFHAGGGRSVVWNHRIFSTHPSFHPRLFHASLRQTQSSPNAAPRTFAYIHATLHYAKWFGINHENDLKTTVVLSVRSDQNGSQGRPFWPATSLTHSLTHLRYLCCWTGGFRPPVCFPREQGRQGLCV
ncbi:hypothetical protein LY76DRAFT_179892 [Colletotrichum caudatum]|nr:hypothetical protein LY76DRAFT_179892 [Colletotrichum caudatum]